MAAKEQRKFVLRRIDRIVWFFVCLFGALAAIGVSLKWLAYPTWELFMQLGFIGGTFALVIVGVLQLSQAFMLEEQPVLQRLRHGTRFFLAIFGALIVLGVFFQVLKYPGWQFYLFNLSLYGLLGGAAALVVTGLLMLGEAFTMEKPDEGNDLS